MSKRKKQPPRYLSQDAGTEKDETDDIYDSEQREKMLDEDEITAAEEGFMKGRDDQPSKKQTRKETHDDSVSVELAKEDAEED